MAALPNSPPKRITRSRAKAAQKAVASVSAPTETRKTRPASSQASRAVKRKSNEDENDSQKKTDSAPPKSSGKRQKVDHPASRRLPPKPAVISKPTERKPITGVSRPTTRIIPAAGNSTASTRAKLNTRVPKNRVLPDTKSQDAPKGNGKKRVQFRESTFTNKENATPKPSKSEQLDGPISQLPIKADVPHESPKKAVMVLQVQKNGPNTSPIRRPGTSSSTDSHISAIQSASPQSVIQHPSLLPSHSHGQNAHRGSDTPTKDYLNSSPARRPTIAFKATNMSASPQKCNIARTPNTMNLARSREVGKSDAETVAETPRRFDYQSALPPGSRQVPKSVQSQAVLLGSPAKRPLSPIKISLDSASHRETSTKADSLLKRSPVKLKLGHTPSKRLRPELPLKPESSMMARAASPEFEDVLNVDTPSLRAENAYIKSSETMKTVDLFAPCSVDTVSSPQDAIDMKAAANSPLLSHHQSQTYPGDEAKQDEIEHPEGSESNDGRAYRAIGSTGSRSPGISHTGSILDAEHVYISSSPRSPQMEKESPDVIDFDATQVVNNPINNFADQFQEHAHIDNINRLEETDSHLKVFEDDESTWPSTDLANGDSEQTSIPDITPSDRIVSITPARLIHQRPRTYHTITKVPLKSSADEILCPIIPARLQRSQSISRTHSPLSELEISGSHHQSQSDQLTDRVDDDAMQDAEDEENVDNTFLVGQSKDSYHHITNTTEDVEVETLDKKQALKGAVVFVDVHTSEGADASGIFVDLLHQMGARCVKEWRWQPRESGTSGEFEASGNKIGITHVVWKDGGKRTLEKAKMARDLVSCVGVGWVLDCERDGKWLEEGEYAIDLSFIPRGGSRRRKSMEPRSMRKSLGKERVFSDSSLPTVLSPSKDPNPATPKVKFMETSRLVKTAAPNDNDERRDFSAGSPVTPFVGQSQSLIQQTCPPKQTHELLFPVSGRIDDQPDEKLRRRLWEARRKSSQFMPRVGSPLTKGL